MDIKSTSMFKIIFLYGIPLAVFQTIVYFSVMIYAFRFSGLVWFSISSIVAYFCFRSLDQVSGIWRRILKTGVFLILINVLSAIIMSVFFLAVFSTFDPKEFGQFN